MPGWPKETKFPTQSSLARGAHPVARKYAGVLARGLRPRASTAGGTLTACHEVRRQRPARSAGRCEVADVVAAVSEGTIPYFLVQKGMVQKKCKPISPEN